MTNEYNHTIIIEETDDEKIRTVDDLEYHLDQACIRCCDNNNNNNDGSFLYSNVPDVVWLGCHRFQKTTMRDDDEHTILSKTGLVEDFGASTRVQVVRMEYIHHPTTTDTGTKQQQQQQQLFSRNAENDQQDDFNTKSHCLRVSSSSSSIRQRQRHDVHYKPFFPQYKDDERMRIKWITIKNNNNKIESESSSSSPLVQTSEEMIQFLQQILLLEDAHEGSPWHSHSTAEVVEEPTAAPNRSSSSSQQLVVRNRSMLECVILQGTNILPNEALLSWNDPTKNSSNNNNDQRRGCRVRVSDICPSWCLFATSSKKDETNNNNNDDWYIFRKLLPRKYLSSIHPITQRPVPCVGCLWETCIVTNPSTNITTNGNDPDNTTPIITTTASTTTPSSSLSYRLVAPPFYDWQTEFPFLQVFLTPTIQRRLQHDAYSIPQWTAWPETVHYGDNDDENDNNTDDQDQDDPHRSKKPTSVPWHVFPLAHCFPSNQVEQFQWVDATCRYVPNTVQLLKQHMLLPPPPADENNHHHDDDENSSFSNRWLLRTALFSRLESHRVLAAHTGWSDLANHVVRVHIPIRIPNQQQSCGLWVDGCVEFHTPDNILIFDDSKIHRAFNYSTEARIVLIVDLVRPHHWPKGTAVGGHSQELDDFIASFSTPK
jgi:hypothetical protein